jgi:DNA-binding NtrC family response regulator
MPSRVDHGFDDVETVSRTDDEIGLETVPTGFVVDVTEGPDVGRSLSIDASRPAPVLVGKSETCDLRLTDRQVSRRHASIDLQGQVLRLVDLDSTNGTYVNGLRVHDVALSGGETIRLGTTALRVRPSVSGGAVVLSTADHFGKLLGASLEMRRLYPLCERLAGSDVPVLIEGETGTGKEVLAESLHEASARASRPFVVFDCTTVAPTLLESALFGHERGAFTGASETRTGVFEDAHGGTLLIDEIGDLDVSLQAKLLRALERREVRRVGGKGWIKVDVRVLSATRRDLDKEVQAGRFRDDLYYRIAVARIELPPLRRRRGDVAMLARSFWTKLAPDGATAPPPELLDRLEAHAWPGNVRELFHAVARYVALGELDEAGGTRRPDGRVSSFDDVLALDLPFARAREKVIEAFERRYVERIVARHGGNVARAAEASGLARRYFQLLRARHKSRETE